MFDTQMKSETRKETGFHGLIAYILDARFIFVIFKRSIKINNLQNVFSYVKQLTKTYPDNYEHF